jgi:hypothetical protein
MTFLLDENFPKAAASVLQSMEHEVFDVREMGMAGCTDAAVLAKAGIAPVSVPRALHAAASHGLSSCEADNTQGVSPLKA